MSLRAQAIAEGYKYVALRGRRVVGFASTKKEAEKLGKPERLPSIPAKYLRGFTGKARVKRAQEILRERREGSYKPLPSDKGVKTKPSSWSVKFQRKYKERPDNLADVARLTGIRKSILQKVYNKGLAAWSTGGHRPGASQHAWAMARVQSFVLGGPTAKGPDKKLAQQAGLVRNPLFPDPPTETTGAKKHRAGASHARTIKLWMGAPSIDSLYHGVHVSPNLSAASAYALGRLRVEEFPAEVIDAPVLIGIGKTCVSEDLGDMDMLTTAHNLWEQSAELAEELVENDGEVDWEDIEIADYSADEYFSELDYLGFRQVLGTLANRPEQADYADALTKMAVYRIQHRLLVLDNTDMDDLLFPTSPKKKAEIKLRKYAISLAEEIVPQVRLPCLVKWEDVVYVGVLPPIAPGTSERPLRDGSGYQESFPYDTDYQEDLDNVDRDYLDRMMDKALVDVYGDRSKVKYWHGTSSTFAASAFPKHLNKAVLDDASFEPEVWEEENPSDPDKFTEDMGYYGIGKSNNEYHPSWDYEPNEEPSLLSQKAYELAFPKAQSLANKLNLGPIALYFIEGEGVEEHLARYINGTSSSPVIVLSDKVEDEDEALLTLYHELGHAYVEEAGIEMSEDEEEEAVENFAIAVHNGDKNAMAHLESDARLD